MPKPLTDEEKLIEKLRRIEALFARPGTEGERAAAASARERILARLQEIEKTEPAIEHKFTMPDMWSHQVFMALLRRYKITPYRYKGQKQTTIVAKVARSFVLETLWPEFEALHETLAEHLTEVTQRVVSQALHPDLSEAPES